ncbi:DUF922 domain-containing protein [uncultured Fluviicola sp.]|uniref:DUF922 domain-containing protein n=1 Tax=uncultured Fluviicola sp. TaxID=463303 RepID=UPI0025EA410F|nr:DUF922 domain-containing protein [uncultured Fluviicola sp.]
MKVLFFTGLLILIGLSSFSFQIENVAIIEDYIVWNQKRKLTWDDFQGKPDEKSTHKAVTSTIIRSMVNIYSDSIVDYDFVCLFEKKDSWKKVQSVNLLNHEQLHFDIGELTTRKLRKEFLEYKFTSLDSINPMINRIFNRATIRLENLGNDYDKETNHGTIVEKQKIWQIKIAKELKELDRYAKTRVVIKRIKSKQ